MFCAVILALPFSAVFAMLSTVLLCIWHIYKCICCLQFMLNLIQILFWCSQMEDRWRATVWVLIAQCLVVQLAENFQQLLTNVGLLFYYCLISIWNRELVTYTENKEGQLQLNCRLGYSLSCFCHGFLTTMQSSKACIGDNLRFSILKKNEPSFWLANNQKYLLNYRCPECVVYVLMPELEVEVNGLQSV